MSKEHLYRQAGELCGNTDIVDNKLILTIEGWDKFWSLHSRIEVPMQHIRSVRHDPNVNIDKEEWPLRLPGTHIPGVITAGTYLSGGKWLFWDVHSPENAIVIELHDEHYSEIVVEVADPGAAVTAIEQAIGSADSK